MPLTWWPDSCVSVLVSLCKWRHISPHCWKSQTLGHKSWDWPSPENIKHVCEKHCKQQNIYCVRTRRQTWVKTIWNPFKYFGEVYIFGTSLWTPLCQAKAAKHKCLFYMISFSFFYPVWANPQRQQPPFKEQEMDQSQSRKQNCKITSWIVIPSGRSFQVAHR